MVKIITDSCSGLPRTIIEKYSIDVLPLCYSVNGNAYTCPPIDSEEELKKFYDLIESGVNVKTSSVNVQTIYNAFEKYTSSNDDVLFICFSSNLSCTYQNAILAKKELEQKNYGGKVYIIDTLLASLGEGLVVEKCAQMLSGGKSITEIIKSAKSMLQNVNSIFTVDSLTTLARGGRISKLALAFSSTLNVKPIMYVSAEGKLAPFQKVIGRKHAIITMAQKVASTIVGAKEQKVYISHANCLDDAIFLKRQIELKTEVKNFEINILDPVIASHSGVGTLAVFYVGLDRESINLAKNVI